MIIFTDADGATDINSLESMITECKKQERSGLSCTIGSRKEDNAQVEVSCNKRHITMVYLENWAKKVFELGNAYVCADHSQEQYQGHLMWFQTVHEGCSKTSVSYSAS